MLELLLNPSYALTFAYFSLLHSFLAQNNEQTIKVLNDDPIEDLKSYLVSKEYELGEF